MSRDTIRLPHDAYRLLQTLRAAGHSAYVVGGCVRDSLLGRLPGLGLLGCLALGTGAIGAVRIALRCRSRPGGATRENG